MKRNNKKEILSDKDIVLYALYILGGWRKRIHTEDIALKCYELAPSKFSWVKYPQYPDIAPARFALEAAKRPENGALVKGGSERKDVPKHLRVTPRKKKERIGGWMLTANGIQWIKANKARIEKYLGKQILGDRLPAERKLKELLNSKAFKKFTNYGEKAEISHAEFAESFLCTVNTGPKVLNDRLEQLYSIAEELNKDEVKKIYRTLPQKI